MYQLFGVHTVCLCVYVWYCMSTHANAWNNRFLLTSQLALPTHAEWPDPGNIYVNVEEQNNGNAPYRVA